MEERDERVARLEDRIERLEQELVAERNSGRRRRRREGWLRVTLLVLIALAYLLYFRSLGGIV